MRQTATTIIVPINPKQLDPPGSLEARRQRLAQLRGDLDAAQANSPPSSGATPIVKELTSLLAVPGGAAEAGSRGAIHYLSFFLIGAAEGCPAYVVLEISSDGSAADMRERLVAVSPRFVLELFAGSAGLTPDGRGLRRFLERHSVPADAFYVAFPGRSVAQIRREQRLRLDVRSSFEAEGSPAPAGGCPRASHARSQRLSPTSAMARWRRLRDAFIEHASVQKGTERPWLVRWSLHGGLFRERLELWGKRLTPPLVLVAALVGLWSLERDPELESVRSTLRMGALGLGVAWWGWIAVATAAEAPRSLALRGRLLVLRGASGQMGRAALSVAVALGLVALAGSVAHRWAPSVSIASALALGAVLLGLARAGLRRTALGTGMLVLLFAGLLPAGQLLLLPAVALSVLFLWLLVLLAAYLFVMAGRALALLLPALLGAAGIALVTWQARSSGLLVPELLVRWAAGGAILSCTLLAGGALWLAAWLVAVRREEHRDVTRERRAHQPGRVHWDVEHLDRVQEREDTGLQNHLITVSRLKPGGLRLRTLRRVLRGVQLVAKIYANRGDLGGIRTIHFARFIILPDQKRLLFLANYDGGFASYLHEFNAVSGVTAVWSNCVGFPRSYFLVGDGASDEQRFKAFGRRDQLETLGWYSAYPELSIRDIEFATQTREDLQRPLDDPASWLGRLRARFGLPLSEADCDLALRRL